MKKWRAPEFFGMPISCETDAYGSSFGGLRTSLKFFPVLIFVCNGLCIKVLCRFSLSENHEKWSVLKKCRKNRSFTSCF